jgi:hypothetical protein
MLVILNGNGDKKFISVISNENGDKIKNNSLMLLSTLITYQLAYKITDVNSIDNFKRI